MKNNVSLLLATPCKDGRVTINYTVSLMQNIAELAKRNIPVQFDLEVGKAGVDMPRCLAATRFLNGPHTHMLFIDDDMAFAPEIITRLIDCDVDIVGVPVRKKQPEPQYNLRFFGDVEQHPDNPALIKIYDIGTGMMMIKKEVFQKLAPKVPFVLEYGHDYEVGMFFRHDIVDYEHAEGAGRRGGPCYMSEDLNFCRLAREEGFDIWAYVDTPIVHYGNCGFGGTYREVLEAVCENRKFRDTSNVIPMAQLSQMG